MPLLPSSFHVQKRLLPMTQTACAGTIPVRLESRHIPQEKLDHVGIVALIIGTPGTALMAKNRGEIPWDIFVWAAAMVVSAFLGKRLRILGFVGGSCIWASRHTKLVTPLLGVQICLYLCGAAAFLGQDLKDSLLKVLLGCSRHS